MEGKEVREARYLVDRIYGMYEVLSELIEDHKKILSEKEEHTEDFVKNSKEKLIEYSYKLEILECILKDTKYANKIKEGKWV